ncbi:DUF2332 domain-containing protein [Nocardioides pacificus]
MELFADVAEQYRDFAAYSLDDSPCLAEWALRVAEDAELMEWLQELPRVKRQPNLVFAAARWHGVPAPGEYDAFRAALLADTGAIRETIRRRSTQTNEVGRLATLMPALARISRESLRPLALLEVGASAGLCLYPDRYSYRWDTADGARLLGSDGPLLTCAVAGDLPVPEAMPEVAWRGGIDLHPLDVTDEDAMAWLTTLVYPEQDERRERLDRAVEIAQEEPPTLVRGDLLVELPALVDVAARHGQVVVFHSAVIAYLEPEERADFHRTMTRLVGDGACRWVSNEGKRVLPEVTATGPSVPDDVPTFVLGVDGRATAWTHPHGRSMRWLG